MKSNNIYSNHKKISNASNNGCSITAMVSSISLSLYCCLLFLRSLACRVDPRVLGDGQCDHIRGANTAECGWDGGDCCEASCISTVLVTCGSDSSYNCLDPAFEHWHMDSAAARDGDSNDIAITSPEGCLDNLSHCRGYLGLKMAKYGYAGPPSYIRLAPSAPPTVPGDGRAHSSPNSYNIADYIIVASAVVLILVGLVAVCVYKVHIPPFAGVDTSTVVRNEEDEGKRRMVWLRRCKALI